MKTIYQTLLTLVVCLVLQLFLPWWSLAVGAAVVAFFFDQSGWRAFLGGFVAAFLLWGAAAAWLNSSGGSLLADRLNQLLPVNSLLLTGLVGGLVGGLAALTGKLVRSA
jgi:hypothetical protein